MSAPVQWPPHHVILEWEWGLAYGLWNADPRPPIDPSAGGGWGPLRPGALTEDDPIAALLSHPLRVELKQWNLQAPEVMNLLDEATPAPDAQARIDRHFAQKAELARRVQAELGPDCIVSWEDANGIEHRIGGTEGRPSV
jgi:hypothetical protein